jgi:hypothetical protein
MIPPVGGLLPGRAGMVRLAGIMAREAKGGVIVMVRRRMLRRGDAARRGARGSLDEMDREKKLDGERKDAEPGAETNLGHPPAHRAHCTKLLNLPDYSTPK